MTDKFRVSISMPCYGRPLRTKRAIESILSQDTNGWEAIIQGDCCPHFQQLIDTGYMEEIAEYARSKGNDVIYRNTSRNYGGCGYRQTNWAIQNGRGKYFTFMANDDVITSDHLSHYLEIEQTTYDYMYFNSFLHPINEIRYSVLAPSQIGHSEIIVKTSLARTVRSHHPRYGHDWDFINGIVVKSNGNGIKSKTENATYHVMHIPSFGTKDIID